MFFEKQSVEEKQKYESLLKITGALSRLSSHSDIPFLYYRMVENIFCEAFGATNLARSDISLDAKKDTIGLGLKTFICNNGHSFEKIAEFNRNKHLIDAENCEINKIKLIAKMRNERLETTSGITDLSIENMFYHYVVRQKGKLLLCETPMCLINIDNIKIGKNSVNTISFSDDLNDYSFNFSKSTLYKSFNVEAIHEFDINIFENPYEVLQELLPDILTKTVIANPIIGTVYLPLYSIAKDGIKHFPTKSGLNQWNALGRPRNLDEVYIKIPLWIHREFPDFFPAKDTSFTLRLPNGSSIVAKVCQQGGKALMSNPNSALGDWLLRSVLRLKPDSVPVSYNQLEQIGIDSVEIDKFADETFEINFKKLGTFEKFKENHISTM